MHAERALDHGREATATREIANLTAELRALRLENAAHHYAGADEELKERSKQRLMEAFCPRSPRWRIDTLNAALRVLSQAVRATT